MALKPNRSNPWGRKRSDTSTASTERWPTPSGATGAPGERRRDVSLWRNAAYLTSLGWIIVLPIAAGILLGRLIDGALDTAPYATVVLLCVGIAAACVEGYLAAARALRVIHHRNGS